MSETETQHFLAVLANVDTTISLLPAPAGPFRFVAHSSEYLVPLLSKLQFLHEAEVLADLRDWHRCILPDGKIMTLRADVEVPSVSEQQTDAELRAADHVHQSVIRQVEQYVDLLRLFKDSAVSVPHMYFFRRSESWPQYTMAQRLHNFAEAEPLTISDEDVERFSHLSNPGVLPFKRPYLTLAHEHFSQSFIVDEPKLKFLVLMIAVEVLFSVDKSELRYRLSRAVAVLLGTSLSESKAIFKEARELYDLRSVLVHTGAAEITALHIHKLRSLVRRALLEVAACDLGKEELSAQLTERGFGRCESAT